MSLSDLGFVGEPIPSRQPSRFKTFTLFIVGTIVGTILIAGPAVVGGIHVVNNVVNSWWDAIPVVGTSTVTPERSYLLDKNGKQFATFYIENRNPVKPETISPYVKNAVIAAEDSSFYEHSGVDWKSTLRAAVSNLSGNSQRQGGSGITQQYVKNLLVSQAQSKDQQKSATRGTIGRKLVEAKSAIELEKDLTKDEILAGYLNTVYFGNRAYGISSAAKTYYNTTPDKLTIEQAATLIGIVNSPTNYDPVQHPAAAEKRRNHVLQRMYDEGFITAQELETAKNTKIKLNLQKESSGCTASKYPFYCAWVLQELKTNKELGETTEEREHAFISGGFTITTALDPQVQDKATKVAEQSLSRKGAPATAVAVVEPGSGHVSAIATNRRYGTKKGETEVLLPVVPAFQSGSTFKPLTAAAAIEAGVDPNIVLNAPDRFIPNNRNYPNGGFRNNGDGPGGTYNMAAALRASSNTWFLKLEDQIGVRKTAKIAEAMGLKSLPLTGNRAITERDASLTLGSYETSVLQVAASFATIAAKGEYCTPTPFISGTNRGEPINIGKPECQQVISPTTAAHVSNMLTGVISSNDPGRTGKNAALKGGRVAMGKTGTTDGNAAVWFAGATPQYATAVWIGDPRGGFRYPVNQLYARGQWFNPVYGGGAPALIWKDIMDQIHQGLPKERFAKPGAVVDVNGNITMPDVSGLSVEAAKAILLNAGFTNVQVKTEPSSNQNLASNVVTGTLPKTGTVVPQDVETVTLIVTP